MSPGKRIHPILVTRQLTVHQVEFANMHGLQPLICPGITVHFPEAEVNVQQSLKKNGNIPWIITSKNAARALEKMAHPAFANSTRRIYVVGDKTAKAVYNILPDADILVPEKQTAEGLAGLILKVSSSENFIYFCGNRSTGILQSKLKNAGKMVKKVIVYNTELNEMDFPDERFEAVLFFSPSAIEAYRKSGGFEKYSVKLFAIGPTTAGALRKVVSDPVFVSPEADTSKFLEYAAVILKAKAH